ncbi:hypothetical protein [Ornithinimicrobium sufpigmenti]|uniref:hypothetical protein n=1 Tax=Ornithinimicrobium sufpigmenti TaxID=2508882 RepID=UPI00103571B6|nr:MULTISPECIES: hypothetical protein [unclassified Ornithinimicrobium]
MSEADRDVLALLDRAAADSPPLHLDRDSVVGRGRQMARRRRAAGAGMAIGGLTLAGAVWLGLGEGSVLGSPEVSPASVTWEVREPTVLTVLDGVTRGGNVSPLIVTKRPDGSASATFTVEGVEETVEGTTMAGGADVFVGERATVVVWDAPAEAYFGADFLPAPQGWEVGASMGDDDIFYLTTTDRGYVPEHLVLHDSARNVWTADGLVAETGEVTDGRHSMSVFSLPEIRAAGWVDESGIEPMAPDSPVSSGGTEPWWRGGEDYEFFLVRAVDEARFVRLVWNDHEGSVVRHGEPVPATVAGGAAFAVFSFTRDEVPVDRDDYASSYQWSTDGQTWHDRVFQDASVEGLPTSVDRVELSLGPDGEPVATKEGVKLPLSAEQPRGEAWSWDDADESVVLVAGTVDEAWVPVLSTGGGLGPAEPFLAGSTSVRVGDREMTASRLPEGTAYLGSVQREVGSSAEEWTLLGGDSVPAYPLGPEVVAAVDEAQGLWFARRAGEGGESGPWGLLVGEVDGEGLVLGMDGTRHRVAVLSVTSDAAVEALPVLTEGSVVLRGVSRSTGGVTVRATEVQCLKMDERCVEGLDTDGDGAVDLPVRHDSVFAWALDEQPEDGTPVYGPGETVTIHGRDFIVRDTTSGWPALRLHGSGGGVSTVDGDGQRTRVDARPPEPSVYAIPGAWPWSEEGLAVSVPGLVLADDLQPVVEVDGTWVKPAQVLVAQGRSGQVTLLVMEPGTDGATARVGVRTDDGTVAELP